MRGGPPRLRIPVTAQSISIAAAFAAATARTLDAPETTVEAVRLVVAEMATLLEGAEAAMIIETDVHAGAHALVVSMDGNSHIPDRAGAIVESAFPGGVVIEADRWLIPITEAGQ